MKLTNIQELKAFQYAVSQCEGDVWLESPAGDKFNLKSAFSQYIALGALLSEHGDELELFCQDSYDETWFHCFFKDFPEVL